MGPKTELVVRRAPADVIVETIQRLAGLGITTKLITGDNRLVAAHVAGQAGMPVNGGDGNTGAHIDAAAAVPGGLMGQFAVTKHGN